MSLKLTNKDNNQNTVTFGSLKINDLFLYRNDLYVKTMDSASNNCFNLTHLYTASFSHSGTEVVAVDGELIYKKKVEKVIMAHGATVKFG